MAGPCRSTKSVLSSDMHACTKLIRKIIVLQMNKIYLTREWIDVPTQYLCCSEYLAITSLPVISAATMPNFCSRLVWRPWSSPNIFAWLLSQKCVLSRQNNNLQPRKVKHSRSQKPNLQETAQLATYKRGRGGVGLGTTEKQIQFYNNWATSRALIGRELWSIRVYTMMWKLRALWLVVSHDLLKYRHMDDVTGNFFLVLFNMARGFEKFVTLFRIKQAKSS